MMNFKNIKPIKTKEDYKKVLSFIKTHFNENPKTQIGETVEILTILIEKYEEENFPIEKPEPIEAIKFRMEQMGLTTKDVAKILGGRNRLSEIFNKKRTLSINMMRNLHEKLQIPADILLGV